MSEASDEPLARAAYDQMAAAFAARVDTKPHNAYYERPATLSLLPEVRGKQVFDAGCGPGVSSKWLVRHGATVFAADASANMVALARRRLGDAVPEVLHEPLPTKDFMHANPEDYAALMRQPVFVCFRARK